MTKHEFIQEFKRNGDFPSDQVAREALDAFVLTIKETLIKKESISLLGLGTFSTVEVAEKSGKIPGTDKTYTKAAHTAPKFKMSKGLKDALV